MSGFEGFPEAALDFYDDLEMDNSKSFWTEHKEIYETAVKQPMQALLLALEPEFGEGKIFRPYRDVRFAKDKTPYKTHQGGYVAAAPATGWYVQVDARGVLVGAGFYDASAERLGRFRDAIVNERSGRKLKRIVTALESAGWEVGGDCLKTSPRGYDADHPRIDLLRHKTLTVRRHYGFESWIHSAELLDRVREDWRTAKPLVAWVEALDPD